MHARLSGTMAEFGKEKYGVDVLKVEVPVQMEFVEGTKSFKGKAAYTKAEALQHFRDAAANTHKPFIYLSAGVSNPVFIETLEFAGESRASFNGVLCGRATWKDGIPIYAKQGAKAFEAWLKDQGLKNIQNVNRHSRPLTPGLTKWMLTRSDSSAVMALAGAILMTLFYDMAMLLLCFCGKL